MTAEHMASCQNKRSCAPEQQKQGSPHRDRDIMSRSLCILRSLII